MSEKRGKRETRIFYAPDRETATAYAQRWGRRTGHKMYRPKS